MACSPVITFRVPDDDLRKLDYLVETYGSCTRSALLLSWIRAEYDRVDGSPELQEMLAKARELMGELQRLTGK